MKITLTQQEASNVLGAWVLENHHDTLGISNTDEMQIDWEAGSKKLEVVFSKKEIN